MMPINLQILVGVSGTARGRRRHCETSDVPNKANQFARDGDDRDAGVLAARCQRAVPLA